MKRARLHRARNQQQRAYAPASAKLWTLMLAARAYKLDSSMGKRHDMRGELVSELQRELTDGDVFALKALAERELHRSDPNLRAILEWLGKVQSRVARKL